MKISCPKSTRRQSGFTLIELLIVVVIIGIIASIAISRFQGAVKASNEAAAISAVKTLLNASVVSQKDAASFSTLDELIAAGTIDSAFGDGDGNPNTGVRGGYNYLFTHSGTSLLISAIPTSTNVFGTGYSRIGTSNTGVLYRDLQNLETHYLSEDDLKSGTSAIFNP